MRLWLTALFALSTILPGDVMANEKKPVKPVVSRNLPRVVPYNDKGRVLLEKGTRQSVGNEGELVDMDHLMEMLNINLRDRIEKAKSRPKKVDIRSKQDRLQGLFGSRK
jgi:hypothetical protein